MSLKSSYNYTTLISKAKAVRQLPRRFQPVDTAVIIVDARMVGVLLAFPAVAILDYLFTDNLLPCLEERKILAQRNKRI